MRKKSENSGQFKAGQPNPGNGRPKMPADIVAANRMTITEARAKLCKYLGYTIPQIQELIRDQNTQALDRWICSIIALGIKEGDEKRLSWIFDRLFGKQKEADITIKPIFDLHTMPRDDMLKLVMSAVKVVKNSAENTLVSKEQQILDKTYLIEDAINDTNSLSD